MQLNELSKNMEGVLPPTDSRFRPDIRAMEEGDIGMVFALDLTFCQPLYFISDSAELFIFVF